MASRRWKSSGSSWRACSLLLAMLAGGAFLAGCAAPPARPPRTPDDAPAIDAGDLSRRTHDALNAARRREGRAPLAWDEALVALARRHSEDMARRRFFGHRNPDGEDVNARAAALGLECRFSRGDTLFSGFAENLFQTHRFTGYTRTTGPEGTQVRYAWQTADQLAEQAVQEWLASPGHRRTLLNPLHRRHAIGVAFGPEAEVYFTDVFC